MHIFILIQLQDESDVRVADIKFLITQLFITVAMRTIFSAAQTRVNHFLLSTAGSVAANESSADELFARRGP